MARSEEQQLYDKERIEAFLKDESVVLVLDSMEALYYLEFKQAVTSDDRVRAWAKAHYLDDFKAGLRTVVNNGHLLQVERDRKARDSK